MVVSGSLAVCKIIVGVWAHSAAVVSDGIESASDVFASGIVLLGLALASKPADEEHPYGHGRFETLAGLAVGLMLTATGAGICVRAYGGLGQPAIPAIYAIWPLIASAVLKTILSTIKVRYGRRIGSESLLADALNDTVDILSANTALIAVSLAIWNPDHFGSADGYGAMGVGLIVMFLGGRVCYDTTNQLMDVMPEREKMDEIRRAAIGVPGALNIEKCYARKTGLRYHVDLHLEVAPNMTVRESHFIAHEVRDHVLAELPWVADVLVHVEPHAAVKIESGLEWKTGK
jgi:cation diffusion facilitator family transporter